MARPPAHASTPAVVRIETAFWELLTSMKYADITIATLARRAGVNHNTIYYHYRGLDDIALSLIDKLTATVPLEAVAHTITASKTPKANITNLIDTHPDIPDLFTKATLIARSGSSDIIAHLRHRVEERWLNVLAVHPEQASQHLRLLLTFMTGGMLSALATTEDSSQTFHDIFSVFSHSISPSVITTLTTLAEQSR